MLSLSLSLSLLDIDFEGENLLKISREGEITGDDFLNRGLVGDDTREREIDEGKLLEKRGLAGDDKKEKDLKENSLEKDD